MHIYVINLRKSIGKICALIMIIVLIFTGIFSFRLLNLSSLTESTSSSANPGRVIIIDAGHGGEDPGAIGINGIYEKDLNLELSMILGEMLIEKGYTVLYTRTEDKMLYTPEENIKGMRKISDLKNRCIIANSYDDAIMISIHMNTYGSSKYSGLQVYYQNDNPESQDLAKSVQSSVREMLQPENKRSVKDGNNIFILENCKNTSVLIECGFLSNKAESEKLSEKEYQKQLSFSILCGIINYIDKLDAK